LKRTGGTDPRAKSRDVFPVGDNQDEKGKDEPLEMARHRKQASLGGKRRESVKDILQESKRTCVCARCSPQKGSEEGEPTDSVGWYHFHVLDDVLHCSNGTGKGSGGTRVTGEGAGTDGFQWTTVDSTGEEILKERMLNSKEYKLDNPAFHW